MASRVLAVTTSAANKPINTCSNNTSDRRDDMAPPASIIQPAAVKTQIQNEKRSTGLLPKASRRQPRNKRLLRPPRNMTEVTNKILPSDIPDSVRKATVKVATPP